MVEETAVARPPMWKSFLAGFFLFTLVLAPAVGMFFYFYNPVTAYFGWYVGTSLLLGVAVGAGLSAIVAAVFARKASR
ncbi:MAG: hypothetical protein FJ149_08100 [Euryarchaeota archaeon]|nr:hypothetical protein [Euryarchaeota archaeon]